MTRKRVCFRYESEPLVIPRRLRRVGKMAPLVIVDSAQPLRPNQTMSSKTSGDVSPSVLINRTCASAFRRSDSGKLAIRRLSHQRIKHSCANSAGFPGDKRFVSTRSRRGQQAHAVGRQTIVGGNKTGGMVAEHWPAGDVRFTTGKPGHQG